MRRSPLDMTLRQLERRWIIEAAAYRLSLRWPWLVTSGALLAGAAAVLAVIR